MQQDIRMFLPLLFQDPVVGFLYALLFLTKPQVVSLQVLQCSQVSQHLPLALQHFVMFPQEARVVLAESEELLAEIHQDASQASHLVEEAFIFPVSAVKDLQKLGSLQHTSDRVVATAPRAEQHQCSS